MGVAILVHTLELPGDCARELEVLSASERQRAARFLSNEPRERYVACRAALRLILATELRCAPQSLAFAEGPHGKPHLSGPHAGALHFNLSHSAERALIAVSPNAPVGVDIERWRRLEEIERLAEKVFSPLERERWLALAPAARQCEFYRHWTLKEAILKACGAGITQSLAAIGAGDTPDTARGPLDAPELLRDSTGTPLRWSLFEIEAAPGYSAALATQCPGRPVLAQRAFDWRELSP
jgi:4'-phosphopantetheinyl transferase